MSDALLEVHRSKGVFRINTKDTASRKGVAGIVAVRTVETPIVQVEVVTAR